MRETTHDPDALRVDRLRRTGLAVTRPRLKVLEVLEHATGHHLSVDDIVATLGDQGISLPRASVYNVVRDLAGVGLVMQADVGPGRALYEVAVEWHHHFVCRRCGQVVDVPCVEGSKPCLATDVPGLAIDEAQVIFRGLCAQCVD